MLNRRILAVAIAALACAGNAAAGADHKGEIEVLSWSLGATSSPAAAGDLAAPAEAQPIALLVPAVQKVREAAARTQSELTPQERAAYVGANRSMTVGGNRSETVKGAPLTPLDDVRPKGQKILQNAPRAQGEKYLEFKMEDALISSLQPGSAPAPKDLSAPKPPPSAAWYAKFDGVDGSGKQSVPGARPPAPVPHLVAPQRSPLADGTSSTLMIGEKIPRPAPVPAAPAARR